MEELVLKRFLNAGISIATEILGNRVKELNNKLLEEKKKKASDKLKNEKEYKEAKKLQAELNSLKLSHIEEIKVDLEYDRDKSLENLIKHLKVAKEWSGFVAFKDLKGQKRLNDIYIELDTYLMPIGRHFDDSERGNVIPIQDAIFSNQRHVIVLGQPGAGKTTSMKKLCSSFFDGQRKQGFNFPILFRFREHKVESDDVLHIFLKDLLGLNLLFDNSVSSNTKITLQKEVVYSVLDELKPIVILDGFDELATEQDKVKLLNEIRQLFRGCRQAKFVLTCRAGEFNYDLDFSDDYEISSLSKKQIEAFAENWIEHPDDVEIFLRAIESSPFSDTVIKPLSLAHLCAIFERTKKIPERPKSVYKKVVNLMLDEWDQQRSIIRESKYSRFESDRKFEFLTHLSYFLTVNGSNSVFTDSQLREAYVNIHSNFGLPLNEAKQVVTEIESHTGLFIQSGYLKYEFVHKSLQEYLTAEYLVKLPNLYKLKNKLELLGAELAIATALSSNPSEYFSEIVLGMFAKRKLTDTFYSAFISRIAQERPDFYFSEDLVLAAFSLLSKQYDVLSKRQEDERYILLMKKMLESSGVGVIANYYEISKPNEFGVMILLRKKSHDYYDLESKLHITDDFFKGELISFLETESEKSH